MRALGSLSFAIYVMYVTATALMRTLVFRLGHVDNVPIQLLADTVAGLTLPVLAYTLLSRAGLSPWFGFAHRTLRPDLVPAPLAAKIT